MKSQHTKTKVITGYIALFILILVSVIFIYQQIKEIAIDEKPVSNANRKLFMIGNTITSLYEAEALSNSFLQTGNQRLFNAYIHTMENVDINIDSLTHLTIEKGQKNRIDSINLLLEQKTRNLKELIRIKQSLSPDEFYNKALSSIEANRDSIREFLNIHKKTIRTQDSSVVLAPKKRKGFLGLFGKKQDSTVRVTVSQQVIVDSVNTQANDNQTDSVVHLLKSVWTDIRQKNEDITEKINRREYNIVLKSTAITEQLKRILSEFEREEINNSIQKTEQKQEALNESSILIAKIAIIAVLLIVLFCFLILRDISKSLRYRKELEEAKQYADRLLESREKMMITVTHDIKSPLGSIIGYIELLRHTHTDTRQDYYLKNMKSSSEHILNLVTKLLDFSYLDTNRVKPEEINYNPAQLLQEIGESFLPQSESKGLSLDIEIDPSLDQKYLGDALRIRQIVINILSNAVKYTHAGSVKLEATAADNQIVIKVKDTGLGISEAEQSIIFNEFTRLASEANKDIEGSGLGLAITHKLVSLLDGKITLESVPDQGSCFTVCLPLKEAHVSSTPMDASGLRILIIDDDKLQLEMSASLLKTKGIRTDITTSPAEAMEKLAEHRYNLVFTDIQMPDIDGFQLVRQIRASGLSFAKEIPVIALSARADMNETTFQDAGFSAYLSKPFSASQLFELIGNLTSSKFTVSSEKTESESHDLYTLNSIQEFTDHDPEATMRIVQSFIHDTEQNVELLQSYTESDEIQQLAHKMLPMFRQLGAHPAVAILEKLEHREQGEKNVTKMIGLSLELIRALKKDYDKS